MGGGTPAKASIYSVTFLPVSDGRPAGLVVRVFLPSPKSINLFYSRPDLLMELSSRRLNRAHAANLDAAVVGI